MTNITVAHRTVYICSNGKEFNDQKEAEKYEAIQILCAATHCLDREELFVWILERFELKKDVVVETPDGRTFLNTSSQYFGAADNAPSP